MGLLAAKHTDLIVGMDMHLIQPPPPAAPVMVPIPVAGMIMDPADYAPGACTVYVNGLPRARAGSMCVLSPPHVPIGGMFVKPPLSEAEIEQGSDSVTADGEAMSAMSHRVLGCHDVGTPAPVRAWKTGGAKSLMKAGSAIIVIPAGGLVFVGGAPTTSASSEPVSAQALDWIRIEIVDQDGNPFVGAQIVVELADGSTRSRTVPADGIIELVGVHSGCCKVWAYTRPPLRPLPCDHIVQQGEWIGSIAWQHGLSDWQSAWDDDANAALRGERMRPSVLAPGDRVHIPRPDPAELDTGASHRLELVSPPRPYTIRLHGNASDLPTSLDFARCTSAGHFPLMETLDFEAARASGSGRFEMDILPDTRALILRTEACVWMVRIGHVDPLPDAPPSVAPASVVQRLVALGLLASRTRANGGEASSVEDALCVFQGTFMGLEEPHGTLDAATLDALFAHVDEESA